MNDELKACLCVYECMFQCCRDDKGIFRFVDESLAHDLVYAHMAMVAFVMKCTRDVTHYFVKSGDDCFGHIDH